jgi:hypothetical protein
MGKLRAAHIAALWIAVAGVIVDATVAFAQTAPQTPPVKDKTAHAKKKPAATPPAAVSAAAPAPAEKVDTSENAAQSDANNAQNPLAPVFSIPILNDTNFGLPPHHQTQNVTLVEPIIPFKISDQWNIMTRWISPIIYEPRASPFYGPEFGLGNISPQFFLTPAHPGSIIWGAGTQLFLPTATDTTLGVNRGFGGGPLAVVLTIQGPLLVGVLANNIFAGTHGSSATLSHINQMTIEPIFFYNVKAGWYVCSLPVITSDWTVQSNRRWTVPFGGGFGRVFRIGDHPWNFRFQAFYNRALSPAAGITNVGTWTAQLLVQVLFP